MLQNKKVIVNLIIFIKVINYFLEIAFIFHNRTLNRHR